MDSSSAAVGGARGHGSYDREHLQAVLDIVLNQLYGEAQWDATVEYGDTTVYTREIERPFTLYQCGLDLAVPASFATRSVVRQSRATEANAFTRSQDVVARLEEPDPLDPDGLGRVVVLDNRQVIFGWKINTLILFACRRLPDGSSLAMRVPVDLNPDGVWTTRRWKEKMFSLCWWQVKGTSATSCRLTFTYQEQPVSLVRHFPAALARQLFARGVALFVAGQHRVVLADLPAQGGPATLAGSSYRPFAFASGSASAPLHMGGIAAGLEPHSPFVVHRPMADLRPAAQPNDLFVGLAGISQFGHPSAAEASRALEEAGGTPPRPFASGAQIILPPGAWDADRPQLAPKVAEAARASYDLAFRMERMSISGSRGEKTGPPEARAEVPPPRWREPTRPAPPGIDTGTPNVRSSSASPVRVAPAEPKRKRAARPARNVVPWRAAVPPLGLPARPASLPRKAPPARPKRIVYIPSAGAPAAPPSAPCRESAPPSEPLPRTFAPFAADAPSACFFLPRASPEQGASPPGPSKVRARQREDDDSSGVDEESLYPRRLAMSTSPQRRRPFAQ